MIRQLFYVSRARAGLTRLDVQDILAASRRRNDRRDVTGCLLFANGAFAQGHVDAVSDLAERIRRELRHTGVRVIAERDVVTRSYGGWSMASVHDLRLEDDVHHLLTQAVSVSQIDALMGRIRPDSVMGGL